MNKNAWQILAVLIGIVIVIAAIWHGNSLRAAGTVSDSGGSHAIAAGDMVTASITIKLKDGSLVYTTDAALAGEPSTVRASYYREPTCFMPLTVIAGTESQIPGLKDSLNGLKEGEVRHVTLPPDRAFGAGDADSRQSFSCVRTEKRFVSLTAIEYVGRFNTIPKPGDMVQLNPYFPARVTVVNPQQVELENMAVNGARIEGPFGVTTIRVEGDAISLVLDPQKGASFEMNGRKGTIISSEGENFIVDFNHSLAGQALDMTIKVLKVIPGAEAGMMNIKWNEDHDKALEQSRREARPVVLVLYAPWCQFSQKYLRETLADVRISGLAGNFVWARVDCDKDEALKKRYRLESYPLTVIVDTNGAELYRLSGAAGPERLRAVLDCIMSGKAINDGNGMLYGDSGTQAQHCSQEHGRE